MLERFVNPYKSNTFNNVNSKNDMEYDGIINRNAIFNEFNMIDPYKADINRVICQKIKFWPKDYENLELEEAFKDYLTNRIFSTPSLFFALHIFEALINYFFKRREFVNKRISGLSREATELNNTSHYYQPKSKIIIDDFIDEENDKVEENDYFSKKEKFIHDLYNNHNQHNNNLINYSDYYYDDHSRKLRNNRSSHLNGNNNVIPEAKKKKMIEWNETCYICDDFGKLICCEECPNVTHLFCASLNVKF